MALRTTTIKSPPAPSIAPIAHPAACSRGLHRSLPSMAAPGQAAERSPETATPRKTLPTRSTSEASPGSSTRSQPPSSSLATPPTSPSAENTSETKTHSSPSCHSGPRNGTPNTSFANPRNTTTSTASITSRDSRYPVRYCHLGIGDATIRFSNFFCRPSTIENPNPHIADPIRFIPSSPGTTKSM